MSDHPIEYREFPIDPADPDLSADAYAPAAGRVVSEADEDGGGGMQRYLAAALRFKWAILLVTFLGAVAGAAYSRTIPNTYRAEATLWIEEPPRNQSNLPLGTGELLPTSGWMQLVTSYSVLEPVVRQQRLYLRVLSADGEEALSTLQAGEDLDQGAYTLAIDSTGTRFALLTGEDSVIERGRVGEAVGRGLGVDWTPPAGSLRPDQRIDFYLTNVHAAVQGLAGRLQPQTDRDGTFISIALDGSDPVKVTATVNAIIDQYIRVAAELKQAKLAQLSEILGQQFEVAARNLQQAEASLQNFRVNTITLPSDRGSPVSPGLAMTQDPVYDNFFNMKVEREQMHRDREVIARILAEARSAPLSVYALESVPSLARSASLQASLAELTSQRTELSGLLLRYTPQNSQVVTVQERIDELERRTIPAQANALLAELDTRDRELATLVASASADLQSIPPRAIEEARLERSFQSAERLFTTLQARHEEARLAAVSSIPDIRSLDEATVPLYPTNGGAQTRMMLMMLLGSFGLAVGAAILLDRFDPKVRYPDQVTADMGLPILGAVPFIRGSSPSQRPHESNHAIEAFREIRMNAAYAHGTAGPVVFTISSAEAGDGKSFVSSNLALSFAQQGHRTLVIDGDIRRGRLHHFLNGVRTPGLSDLLSQRATLSEVLQTTEVPLVSLIGSGTRMHVGPELLGSTMMASHLRELKRSFDVIIIDTPPLGAGVDPYVLSTLTGNLLMVVRTGNTNRTFAEAKLKLMDRLPVRILGAVLNGIPANQRAYRYYSYLPNYGSREETTVTPDARVLASK